MTPRGATSWPERGTTFNQTGRAASSRSPWSEVGAGGRIRRRPLHRGRQRV